MVAEQHSDLSLNVEIAHEDPDILDSKLHIVR